MRIRPLVFLLLISPVFFALPYVNHVTPMVVLSGSMEPLFNPGDIIFLEKINGSEVHIGDVVAFHPPESKPGTFVTHRIIEIVHENGTAFIKTKGDNNEEPDGFLTPLDNVYGRVVFSIPYLGYMTRYNPNKKNRLIIYLVFTLLPGVGIIVSELPALLYYSPRLDSLQVKLSEYRSRTVESIRFKRLLITFLMLLAISTFLITPSIQHIDGGLVNTDSWNVVVLKEGVKDYEVIKPGDAFEGNYTLAVREILPVLWFTRLYETNPFILKVLSIFISAWGTLLLCPLWISAEPKFKLVRRRNRYALRRV